ncbi:MAG: hypothetical protein KDA93_14355 [Planctomycetaceae bacterium]|nr:hypothetical protein [Planctomycetaceae bacterium]
MRLALPVALLAGVVVWLSANSAQADSPYGTPRQYYSDYTYVPSHGYGYRTYYFKPTESYAGYKHHYVIYPQNDPQHGYYYNPETQQYWGRCPSQCHGEPLYSLLRPSQRKGVLSQIPPGQFPTPGPLPSIPGAQDNTTLDLAPDNTPVPGAAVTGAPPATPAGTPPANPPAVGVGQGPADPPPPGIPTTTAPPADAPPAEAAAAPIASAG